MSDIDFVTKAPDGKEVEELTKKEIHKALRDRIPMEQVKIDMPAASPDVRQDTLHRQMFPSRGRPMPPQQQGRPPFQQRVAPPAQPVSAPIPLKKPIARVSKLSDSEKKIFIDMLNDLVGTRGAYLLDQKLSILGKVPLAEIDSAIKSLGNVNAVVFDGVIEKELVMLAERAGVKYLIAMDSRVKPAETSVNLLTINDI